MNNILEFIGSLFSLFNKKEVKVKPEVKPKVEEKVVEKVVKPKTSIEELIEKLKDKEKEEPKEPKEPKKPSKTFEDALKFVLKWEGGYSNDPNDPGGETKFGISKKAYPYEDIKNMTLERAEKIYYENYWLKAGCDKLTSPLDIVVFDTAVNMGVSRAKEFLTASSDWEDFLFRRIDFYTKCNKSNIYLKGWINRVVDLYKNVT